MIQCQMRPSFIILVRMRLSLVSDAPVAVSDAPVLLSDAPVPVSDAPVASVRGALDIGSQFQMRLSWFQVRLSLV